MKSIKALFVLALMATLAVPAFAETQNVKVSGSLDAYYFNRTNFDLTSGNDSGNVPAGTAVAPAGSNPTSLNNRSDSDNYFMSITQVQVAANLTDNVSTVINLVNQRDWNADTYGASTGAAPNNTANEFDVDLDLAYVQMKEIFYAPLTLTIGRQDLSFGRGFIVGWNPQDYGGTTEADEYTALQSFDAIRATLDFNPWTLDFVYSNIVENSVNSEDDSDLWIAYVSYKFSEYNAVADGYFVSQQDKATLSAAGAGSVGTDNNVTNTIGGRVQFDPISQITLGAEVAYQFGDYSAAVAQQRDRSAIGVDLFGTYRFDNAWKPEVTLEYVHLSGENDLSSTTAADYESWNGAFRGPIYGWYHDYKEVYWATGSGADQAAGQNQNDFSITGSMNPMADLKLVGTYYYFWGDEDFHTTPTLPTSPVASEDIGSEIDVTLTYAYTEDVTFGLQGVWFFPGNLYVSPNDNTAAEYVSSVKVTF